jgi:uncharacterized RDD family membrane protein YckC
MTGAVPVDTESPGVILTVPGIWRRLAAMTYESVLLFGVLFIATYVFLVPAQALNASLQRALLQLMVFAVCGIYFVWFWRHGGQTLAMKTWDLRLVARNGGPVSRVQALARYLLAWFLIPPFGIAILWALIDRDRQFLHDRIVGTRVVSV